jgi:hypothetical protein
VDRAKWQVSTIGGSSPVWRHDGRELFFAAGATIMAAAIEPSGGFRARVPETLFSLESPLERLGPFFDVSPDGRRFLVIRERPSPARSAAPRLLAIMNWDQVLRGQLTNPR